MEIHGPKYLGASYKDPITSFSLFQKYTVQHPEVRIYFMRTYPSRSCHVKRRVIICKSHFLLNLVYANDSRFIGLLF